MAQCLLLAATFFLSTTVFADNSVMSMETARRNVGSYKSHDSEIISYIGASANQGYLLQSVILSSSSSIDFGKENDFYSLIYVYSGKGIATVEGQTFNLSPGSVYSVGLTKIHTLQAAGADAMRFVKIRIPKGLVSPNGDFKQGMLADYEDVGLSFSKMEVRRGQGVADFSGTRSSYFIIGGSGEALTVEGTYTFSREQVLLADGPLVKLNAGAASDLNILSISLAAVTQQAFGCGNFFIH